MIWNPFHVEVKYNNRFIVVGPVSYFRAAMEEVTTDEAILWPLQDEGYLTANATSYVDDYLQAVELEQYFDSTLLSPDALYPDLYGAVVDWETVLQHKYGPVTRTEQLMWRIWCVDDSAEVEMEE